MLGFDRLVSPLQGTSRIVSDCVLWEAVCRVSSPAPAQERLARIWTVSAGGVMDEEEAAGPRLLLVHSRSMDWLRLKPSGFPRPSQLECGWETGRGGLGAFKRSTGRDSAERTHPVGQQSRRVITRVCMHWLCISPWTNTLSVWPLTTYGCGSAGGHGNTMRVR